ncbi:MAG: fibronectin type III domain-containing protein [Candidatus Brocadiia bacterium]
MRTLIAIAVILASAFQATYASATPPSAGAVFVANCEAGSFDVVWITASPDSSFVTWGSYAAPDLWPPENVGEPLFPTGPSRVHWQRIRLSSLSLNRTIVYFRVSSDPAGVWYGYKPPDSEEAPTPIAGVQIPVRTALGQPLPTGKGLALIRLVGVGEESCWRAVQYSGDVDSVSAEIGGLRQVFGQTAPSIVLVAGELFLPRSGNAVQVFALFDEWDATEAAYSLTDARAGTLDPTPLPLDLRLAVPALPGNRTFPDGNVFFAWASSMEATSYEVQKRLPAGQWTLVGTVAASLTPTYSGIASDGRYEYRVRAVTSGETSDWSNICAVLVAEYSGASPAPPTLAPVFTSSPIIDWPSYGIDASVGYWYEIQVDTSQSFSNAIVIFARTNSASLNLTAPGTYYLRIRAIMPDDASVIPASPWSTITSFLVTLAVPGPIVADTLDTPRLSVAWQPVEPISEGEDVSYELQVATDAAFTQSVLSGETTSTQYDWWLPTDGQYFLRMRATTPSARSEWSATRSFLVSTIPAGTPGKLSAFPSMSAVRLRWEHHYSAGTQHIVQRTSDTVTWNTLSLEMYGDEYTDLNPLPYQEAFYRVGTVLTSGILWGGMAVVTAPEQTPAENHRGAPGSLSGGRAFQGSATGATGGASLFVRDVFSSTTWNQSDLAISGAPNEIDAVVPLSDGSLLITYRKRIHEPLDRLYGRTLRLNASGTINGVDPEIPFSPEYGNSFASVAVTWGSQAAVAYYDSIGGEYRAAFYNGSSFSFQGIAFDSDLSGYTDGNRPSISFDSFGNLHLAAPRLKGGMTVIEYGVFSRNGQGAWSPFSVVSSTAFGAEGVASVGLTIIDQEVSIFCVTLPGSDLGDLKMIQGRSIAGTLQLDVPEVIAARVLRARVILEYQHQIIVAWMQDPTEGRMYLEKFVSRTDGGWLQSLVETSKDVVGFDLTATDDHAVVSYATTDGESGLQVQRDFYKATGGSGSGGGGCFIATAAFGSCASKSVVSICETRDRYAVSSSEGTALLAAYYGASPSLARRIDMDPGVRALLRRFLER